MGPYLWNSLTGEQTSLSQRQVTSSRRVPGGRARILRENPQTARKILNGGIRPCAVRTCYKEATSKHALGFQPNRITSQRRCSPRSRTWPNQAASELYTLRVIIHSDLYERPCSSWRKGGEVAVPNVPLARGEPRFVDRVFSHPAGQVVGAAVRLLEQLACRGRTGPHRYSSALPKEGAREEEQRACACLAGGKLRARTHA